MVRDTPYGSPVRAATSALYCSSTQEIYLYHCGVSPIPMTSCNGILRPQHAPYRFTNASQKCVQICALKPLKLTLFVIGRHPAVLTITYLGGGH